MKIFTKEVAESVIKYYSNIVIGKPITPPGDSNPFSISSLEIVKFEDGYNVFCVCNISGKIAYSNLDKVLPQLNVLPLNEFLSNLN